MKINSNTIKLENQDYKNLEYVIKKIASENKINDIESIDIKLTANEGAIRFKTAAGINSVDALLKKAVEENEALPLEKKDSPYTFKWTPDELQYLIDGFVEKVMPLVEDDVARMAIERIQKQYLKDFGYFK
jgi:hypothetical protein